MVVVDGQGVPLACQITSATNATPAEVTLIESTLDEIDVQPAEKSDRTPQPGRLIYDRAADSDPLRTRLQEERGIELIRPHRRKRKKKATQDGRKLRRYKRRWIVERTFAWFGNFRRLVVRYERKLSVYKAFFHLACVILTMRQL
jgi:transposase